MIQVKNDNYIIDLKKDPKYNHVLFKVLSIVGNEADGTPLTEETTFHGHFGYDLCIHLRTTSDYDGIDHYHHFCNGKDIMSLGDLFQKVQSKLIEGLVPGYKPVI